MDAVRFIWFLAFRLRLGWFQLNGLSLIGFELVRVALSSFGFV